MHNLAFALACVTCVGHGRRTQALLDRGHSRSSEESLREFKAVDSVSGSQSRASANSSKLSGRLDPSQALAALILAVNPSAAFHPAVTSFRPMVSNRPRPSAVQTTMPLPSRAAVMPRSARSRGAVMQFLQPDGGWNILGVGGPELAIILAAAYFVLGPKELFRLSQEAGKLFGQLQQMAFDARDNFQNEMGGADLQEIQQQFTGPLAQFQQAAANIQRTFQDAAVNARTEARAELGGEMPPPPLQRDVPPPPLQRGTAPPPAISESRTNEAQEWAKADVDSRYSAEYPAELPAPPPADGSPMDLQWSDEALLEATIEEAEAELKTLEAEKKLIGLKKKQLEENAERAQRMAAERASKEVAQEVVGEIKNDAEGGLDADKQDAEEVGPSKSEMEHEGTVDETEKAAKDGSGAKSDLKQESAVSNKEDAAGEVVKKPEMSNQTAS